ncbi:hypothetical protein [Nocardia abscessus]|uniref:hypothetical protein n=1 Tax=Nocardia abscessus TaxID=120957 RepID=UPI002456305D|nr:hypothetical protein [Nocardia abscessus]
MRNSAADVFAALRSDVRTDEPAYIALIRLLTFGGRISFQQGMAALTPRDMAVLHQLLGVESLRLRLPSDYDPPDVLLVCQSAQGRLSFMDSACVDVSTDIMTVAALSLTSSMRERVEEEVAEWELAQRADREQLDAMLRRWADTGVLAAQVRQVADWVDHVETVLIYIGDEVFTRSDAGTNTLLRGGVLARLETTALDSWSAAERLFVSAAHLLFATGRSIRFEEFNGRQLTATALREWLVGTRRRYAHAAGQAIPADLACLPLEQLALEIRELSGAVDQSGWIRFRRVAGPTFAKSEVLVELPRSRRSHHVLPPLIRTCVLDTLGISPDPMLPAEAALGQVVEHALRLPPDTAVAAIEQLLATIVRSAAIDVDADYAMSSAVRDIGRLAPMTENRLGTILDLRKPDFFCCVVPNPSRLAGREEAEIQRMLWLVAQRMQYNRWHFLPGNFDRAEVPAQRHYFFPPLMPDVAESSDLWHGGHIAARVRYSLRAPGAQLWRAALNVGGNPHRGCFDIRAVRMSGSPFAREDLWTAVRYSGLVDALWRAVAAQVNEGNAAPVVTAFDRQWYERAAWTECGAFE